MEIAVPEKFLNQTLECKIQIESHGQMGNHPVFIPLNDTHITYYFPTVLIGLNVNIHSIAFRLLTRGISFEADDMITISYKELY